MDTRADSLSDGLHLSVQGCQKLSDATKAVVLQHFPEWNPAVMKMDMPEWSQFETN
jgi:hypothetical protein